MNEDKTATAAEIAIELLAAAEGIDPGVKRGRAESANPRMQRQIQDVWAHAFAVGVRHALRDLDLLDAARKALAARDA